jgi:hypothetical protein
MSTTLQFSNGDMVRLDGGTGYSYVSGKSKVKQDVECVITTDIRKSTGLGCGLRQIIGEDTMMYTSSYTQYPAVFDFQRNLYNGLSRLKSAQKFYQYDTRTPDELIFDFSTVKVWYSDQDPRNYEWSINVFTEDRRSNFTVGGTA